MAVRRDSSSAMAGSHVEDGSVSRIMSISSGGMMSEESIGPSELSSVCAAFTCAKDEPRTNLPTLQTRFQHLGPALQICNMA
jgi:hypothetical protein